MSTTACEIWLCLSGGNALGAYHAGFYRALHEAELRISRICGASIGAIVGAIIAGNKAADRVERLDAFWTIAADTFTVANIPYGTTPKLMGVWRTLTLGRPGLFSAFAPWMRRAAGLSSPSLFDRDELRATLASLIDFEMLNSGEIRFLLNCVDVETGEELVFDTQKDSVSVEHLMASSAFPGLYEPERVGEQFLVDGSLASNLPIRALFCDFPDAPVICGALDLFMAAGTVPSTLDNALHRTQDLLLGWQSKRALDALQREFCDVKHPITVCHAVYRGAEEIGGKMIDYSERSMKGRFLAGMRDGVTLSGYIARSAPSNEGLTIVDLTSRNCR